MSHPITYVTAQEFLLSILKSISGGGRDPRCHLLYMFVAAASRGSCNFLPPVPASQHRMQGVHRQALAAIR